MDINSGAGLLTETTEIVELTFWQKLARIELTPDVQRDLLLYILVLVLLCAISKVVHDIKERRRLKQEFAEYQQRRSDEAAEENKAR